MTLRVLLVDDEPPARARLRALLADEQEVEIVGEAGNGEEAIRLIAERRPDLVFLDVEMPAPDGLEVLRAVRDEWLPAVIFTTAHAQHAVEAFAADAVDYLLKPYSPERLAAAVARARARLAAARPAGGAGDAVSAALAARAGRVERFLVKTGDRYLVVRAEDILWVEAAANYVVLHTAEGRPVLRRPISALEAELDPARFFRASRSALVRLDEIKEVRGAAAGEHLVVLRDGTRIPLTRGLRELQERLAG